MTDEHGVFQPQLTADLDNVLGIAGKHRILSMVIGREVGASRAHMIEEHDFEIVFKFRGHEAPHVLVATEAVGENHSPLALPTDLDVISLQNVQRMTL